MGAIATPHHTGLRASISRCFHPASRLRSTSDSNIVLLLLCVMRLAKSRSFSRSDYSALRTRGACGQDYRASSKCRSRGCSVKCKAWRNIPIQTGGLWTRSNPSPNSIRTHSRDGLFLPMPPPPEALRVLRLWRVES